jgi:hypothetical protein
MQGMPANSGNDILPKVIAILLDSNEEEYAFELKAEKQSGVRVKI